MAGIGQPQGARTRALTTAAIGVVLVVPAAGGLRQRRHEHLAAVRARWSSRSASARPSATPYGGLRQGPCRRGPPPSPRCLCRCVIFVDRTMQSWAEYSASSVIRNRPIKTIGDREGRLEGSFWVITNDTFSHLILPTMALMLISLATYTRYSRASMLEVLNQDYIRTARAKGLTERTVDHPPRLPQRDDPAGHDRGLRHRRHPRRRRDHRDRVRVERDGPAVHRRACCRLDPNPVMAFFVVIARRSPIVANLLADLLYAVLDPRIRIGELTAMIGDSRRARRRRRRRPVDSTRSSLEQNEVVGLSQGQIVRRRFFRHKGAMVSLLVADLHRRPARDHEHRLGSDPRAGGSTTTPRSFRRTRTRRRRCRCDPTWLGGAGVMIGDHPFGLDNEKGRDMFALTMRGVQTTPGRHPRPGRAVDHDRRRHRRARRATTAAGSTPR